MKINNQFVLREIAGEYMLIPVGEQAINVNGIIGLNKVGAFIWTALKEKADMTYVLEKMLKHFDVSEEEAQNDLNSFLTQMKKVGLVE